MKITPGMNAVVTGASRGIGPFIARALGARGVNLVVSARASKELDDEGRALSESGIKTTVIAADLTKPADVEALARGALSAFDGRVDVLVNNAGIENTSFFEQLDVAEIDRTIAINTRAPIVLGRSFVSGMLERNAGHIVNVASLAGVGWVAHGEAYVATKHALVGFTKAFRGSMRLRGSKVSASAVMPGYVSEAGMFALNQERHGLRAPLVLGGMPKPAQVARAVIRAIERDLADLYVNPFPLRPFFAIYAMAPRVAELMARMLGVDSTLSPIAEARAAPAQLPPGRSP